MIYLWLKFVQIHYLQSYYSRVDQPQLNVETCSFLKIKISQQRITNIFFYIALLADETVEQ